MECSLRNLRSGHSHEDVDQFFGSLATYMVKHARHCETAGDVLQVVQAFLDQVPRPYEPLRRAFKVDAVRDWCLAQRHAIMLPSCLVSSVLF